MGSSYYIQLWPGDTRHRSLTNFAFKKHSVLIFYLYHSAIVPHVQLWVLEMSTVLWKFAVFLRALQIACFAENQGVHILWSYEFQRWKEFCEAARTWFHSWLLINIMKDITVCVSISLWAYSLELNLQP